MASSELSIHNILDDSGKFVDVVSVWPQNCSSEVSVILQQLVLADFAESAAVDAGRDDR